MLINPNWPELLQYMLPLIRNNSVSFVLRRWIYHHVCLQDTTTISWAACSQHLRGEQNGHGHGEYVYPHNEHGTGAHVPRITSHTKFQVKKSNIP